MQSATEFGGSEEHLEFSPDVTDVGRNGEVDWRPERVKVTEEDVSYSNVSLVGAEMLRPYGNKEQANLPEN